MIYTDEIVRILLNSLANIKDYKLLILRRGWDCDIVIASQHDHTFYFPVRDNRFFTECA